MFQEWSTNNSQQKIPFLTKVLRVFKDSRNAAGLPVVNILVGRLSTSMHDKKLLRLCVSSNCILNNTTTETTYYDLVNGGRGARGGGEGGSSLQAPSPCGHLLTRHPLMWDNIGIALRSVVFLSTLLFYRTTISISRNTTSWKNCTISISFECRDSVFPIFTEGNS